MIQSLHLQGFGCAFLCAAVSRQPQALLFAPPPLDVAISDKYPSLLSRLRRCPSLRRLWLFSNRIAVMEGLHHCGGLRELWLHDNRITAAAGLKSLVHLQVNMSALGVCCDVLVCWRWCRRQSCRRWCLCSPPLLFVMLFSAGSAGAGAARAGAAGAHTEAAAFVAVELLSLSLSRLENSNGIYFQTFGLRTAR